MTNKELLYVALVLSKITNPDERIKRAQALVDKDLATYAARKGQLMDQYEYDTKNW